MATDTQWVRPRHSKSTICPDAEDHDACETLLLPHGEWERASGIALADAVKYTVMMNMAPVFLFRNSLQLGCQQHSSSCSPVAMVLLFSKLWSESDRVIWKWNECR